MKRSLIIALALLVLVIPLATAAAPFMVGIPTFSITSVVTDDTVTIKTNNYPAGETFTVMMGAYGTLGIGGIVVDTQESGGGGSFSATYDIPAALHGSTRIAIRLESPSSGYYSFNWFWNNTTGGGVPAPAGPIVIPTFSITGVNEDVDVTISTANFPANDTFNVRISAYGTLGVGGILVDTQGSGAGGTFTATYSIPASLAGATRLAIRLESPTTGYYSYNWFWNNNSSGGAGGAYLGPGVIPTFSITGVSKDNAVTIKGINFTTNDTYTVRMGAYGTRGVGGIVADSYATGANGSFTATFTIPAGLLGLTRIAIRLESDSSAYYSYNWFWNANYP